MRQTGGATGHFDRYSGFSPVAPKSVFYLDQFSPPSFPFKFTPPRRYPLFRSLLVPGQGKMVERWISPPSGLDNRMPLFKIRFLQLERRHSQGH